jgi:hypothetical protein
MVTKKSRIIVRRKRLGRPPTGEALELVNFRMSKAEKAEVEQWRKAQPGRPKRSAAFRELVKRGLRGPKS